MQHFIYNNQHELIDIKNINNIDWDKISKDYKLSEEFIEKYKNKVNWQAVLQYQKLSEEFMVYNEDYVIWDIVVEYQHLTEAFIKKYDLKIPDDK